MLLDEWMKWRNEDEKSIFVVYYLFLEVRVIWNLFLVNCYLVCVVMWKDWEEGLFCGLDLRFCVIILSSWFLVVMFGNL